MAKFILIVLICAVVLISQTCAIKWDGLRVTWGPSLAEGYYTKLPRTVTDAVMEGWVKVNSSSTCNNGDNEFYGFRYKLPGDDAINVIFDKNGIIAGVQVLAPHSEILNPENGYRYDLVPMFHNETVNGMPFVVLTAYFVPPETICTTGRTELDLLEEGTGTGLYFQNGPTPNSQIDVPMMRDEAAALGWTNCECFPGMGLHNFWEVSKWADTNCTIMQPTQAIYTLDEEMFGFVFQIQGPTTSKRFETPPNEALYAIIGPSRIPQCVVDSNTKFGSTTVHFYMIDEPWLIGCTKSTQ